MSDTLFDSLIQESFLSETAPSSDVEQLERAFYKLHLAFLDLVNCYVFGPLNEATDESTRRIYNNYIVSYVNTINIAVSFFERFIEKRENFVSSDFNETVAENFAFAQRQYEKLEMRLSSDKMKLLHDAYFSYVYLLRGFNSMIEAYRTSHPYCGIKLIEGVPEPIDLGEFSDEKIRNFIAPFLVKSRKIHSLLQEGAEEKESGE